MAKRPRKKRQANGTDEGAVFDQTAAGAQDADSAPAIGDNSQAVAAAVEEAKTAIRQHQADRNALLEQSKALSKQAASINKKIGNEFRKIKTVAGIDRVQMERALELEDMEPEAREKALLQQALAYHFTGLSEQYASAYASADVGEQIDMLKATDSEPEQAQPNASGSTYNAQQAEATGYADGRAGKRTNADAYSKTAYMQDYERGYLRGTASNVEGAGDPFGPPEGEAATA